MISKKVGGNLSCDSEVLGNLEIDADTCSSCYADGRILPEVVVRCEACLEILSLVIVETEVSANTCEYVRIDNALLITCEEVAEIECSVETELAIIESIFLALAYGTLALNT